MDLSTHNQVDDARSALTLDVTAAPDPSALVPAQANRSCSCARWSTRAITDCP